MWPVLSTVQGQLRLYWELACKQEGRNKSKGFWGQILTQGAWGGGHGWILTTLVNLIYEPHICLQALHELMSHCVSATNPMCVLEGVAKLSADCALKSWTLFFLVSGHSRGTVTPRQITSPNVENVLS